MSDTKIIPSTWHAKKRNETQKHQATPPLYRSFRLGPINSKSESNQLYHALPTFMANMRTAQRISPRQIQNTIYISSKNFQLPSDSKLSAVNTEVIREYYLYIFSKTVIYKLCMYYISRKKFEFSLPSYRKPK